MSERNFEAPLEDDTGGVEPTFGGTEFLGEFEEREVGDGFSGEFGERIHEGRENESREAPGDAPLS